MATLIALIPIYLISLASFWATDCDDRVLRPLAGRLRLLLPPLPPPIDIVYSVIKMIVFTIVVTLIHCYYGYYASGGPAGWAWPWPGHRASIVTIVIINFVLSCSSGATAAP
jgi:phospholipid/cholesterol/gamma-HCH transport system permease protein